MSEKLKPCMCCGKSNRVTIYSTFCYANEKIHNIRFGVKCERCGIELGTYRKKETAIKRWNTSPIEDEKDKEIERLKEVIADICTIVCTGPVNLDIIFKKCKEAIGEPALKEAYLKEIRKRAEKKR